MPLPPWVSLIPGPWPATDPDAVILDLAPAAWWRFHDGSYADAGVTLCVADDPIWQVNDKSGNGRHLTQATLGARPLWKPNVLNGKAVGRFDGINDVMASTFGATLTQPNTIYLVCKFSTANDVAVDGPSGTLNQIKTDAGDPSNYSIRGSATLDSGIQRDTSPHIFTAVFNGASSYLRVDGTAGAVGNVGSNSLSGITLGASSIPGQFLLGDIASLIVFNALHTAPQIAAVEASRASYYGIAI